MSAPATTIVCCALAAVLTGCAATGNGAVRSLTPEHASRTIVIGKSSKADIGAAFGTATVTSYAGGYEVWLYQVGYAKVVDSLPYVNLLLNSADNRKELSILFDHGGLVKKYRLLDRDREDQGRPPGGPG